MASECYGIIARMNEVSFMRGQRGRLEGCLQTAEILLIRRPHRPFHTTGSDLDEPAGPAGVAKGVRVMSRRRRRTRTW